jgi:hypothetical protein
MVCVLASAHSASGKQLLNGVSDHEPLCNPVKLRTYAPVAILSPAQRAGCRSPMRRDHEAEARRIDELQLAEVEDQERSVSGLDPF